MIIIRDDHGRPWTFDGERIKMLGVGTHSGYSAHSWEEAIQILNYQGHLDGSEYEVLTETLDEYVERLR